MPYYLNNKHINDYGLYPVRSENSNVAIAGCWDMPARIGTAYHDWGDENGIEPYLEPGQIFFGGRTITLTVALIAIDRIDAINKIMDMYKDIDAFTGLVTLACDYGSFDVYVNDAIAINYVRQGKATAKLSFRQPVVSLSSPTQFIATETGGEFDTESGDQITNESSVIALVGTGSLTGIDGISFPALGITPLSFTNSFNRPQPKPSFYKGYETEGFAISKRKERVGVLKCLIHKTNYTEFINVIQSLYNLFQQPNEHTLNYFNDKARSFFVKDGFTVTNFIVKPNFFIALININITETGKSVTQYIQNDAGQKINTDNDFTIFTDNVFIDH